MNSKLIILTPKVRAERNKLAGQRKPKPAVQPALRKAA